jgi:hypothetical protein
MSSSISILKGDLKQKSISEKVFNYQKEERSSKIKAAEADLAQKSKVERTWTQVMKERRRVATLENKKDLFLRKPKNSTKEVVSKASTLVKKNHHGSFKSSLERMHLKETKLKQDKEDRKQLTEALFRKHKLSKTISKIILKKK